MNEEPPRGGGTTAPERTERVPSETGTAPEQASRRIAELGDRWKRAAADDEHPPGTVVAVTRARYGLGDRILRPAGVVVARPEA